MIAVTRIRAALVAAAIAAAFALLGSASAQQEPPYRYYGNPGAVEPGDVVSATDQYGQSLGSATADDTGAWHLDVDRDNIENTTFTLNDEPAEASITSTGAGQAEVMLTVIEVEEDPTMADDSMMEDDSMVEDDMLDEETLEEEVEPLDEEPALTFPNAGTGGLVDSRTSTTTILGALAAVLLTVTLGGAALRRYASVARR